MLIVQGDPPLGVGK